MNKTTTSVDGKALVLTRVIDAPPEKVFRAWTKPDFMMQWFARKPWSTPKTARLEHWTDADCEAHEKMGFHVGWPHCTEQLAALVEKP